MNTPLRLLVIFGLPAVAILSSGQTTSTDTVFDGRPPVYKPDHRPEPPGPHPFKNRRVIEWQLIGYPAGEFVHPQTLPYCKRVSEALGTWRNEGWRVERIVLQGFADGLRNPGVALDLSTLPKRCQAKVSSIVDDVALARLRACLVLDALAESSSARYPAGVSWSTDEYDEPDGGRRGPSFRKVRIEVTLSKD